MSVMVGRAGGVSIIFFETGGEIGRTVEADHVGNFGNRVLIGLQELQRPFQADFTDKLAG